MLRSFLARWMHGTRKPYRRQVLRGLTAPARQKVTFRPQLDGLEERTLLSGIPLAGPALNTAYGQLPLSFEVNEGQTDAQVNYLARGQGYTIFLTPQAAMLSLQQAGSTTGVALRMQLVGSNADAQATSSDRLEGVANYYTGSDPSQWHTGIATYDRVAYTMSTTA